MGSLWIIFFFIAEWRMLCGMLFLAGLGYARLGQVVALGVRWSRRWFLCALCGVFGKNIMLDALKTCRGLLRKFFMIFSLLFILRQLDGLPRLLLAIRIFFLVSPLPLRLFLVCFLCTLDCALLRLFKIYFDLSKKKKSGTVMEENLDEVSKIVFLVTIVILRKNPDYCNHFS
jgi:hypothetical protein